MRLGIFLSALVCLVGMPGLAPAGGIDTNKVLQEQLGLSESDAALYWNGLSWTIASQVAEGKRVAVDGLGAFEPAYTYSPDGEVRRTMRFDFDLGPAIEQPCVTSVFDDALIKQLSSFAWLRGVEGNVEKRLEGEEWSRLLDIYVFCVLRNIDGHSRQPLGLGLGQFYPTVDVDLSTERDSNQRRLVVDFVADDDSPEKFQWQYDFSVSALQQMIAILDREAANLNRYHRLTRISEYAECEAIVRAVAAAWSEELDDLGGGTKAQDHNSSRSNKTASIISDGVDDLGDAQNLLKVAAAQDHNSSRSNKTSRAMDNVGDGGAWASEVLAAPAQDHNSSRSNKTASKSPDFYNELIGRYDGAYGTKAQDHNSSRSNKTASVVADFEPGPELEAFFSKAAF